jgi:hypothetical protein
MQRSNGKASRGLAAAIFAIAAFAAALGAAVTESRAQNNDTELVVEVVRTATAGEPESGFCATTGWRLETAATHDSNVAIYENGTVGSTKTFINRAAGQTDYCAYLRLAGVFSEGGQRCVRAEVWLCSVGGQCRFSRFKGCRAPDTWKWTAER